MARKNKRSKREFRPQAHATVYLIALLYVGYLLGSMIWRAVQGGPQAPSGLQLGLGIVVLGGGGLVLAVLTWHLLHLPAGKKGEKDETAQENQGGDATKDIATVNGQLTNEDTEIFSQKEQQTAQDSGSFEGDMTDQ